jgi:hypothetical protein
MTRLIQKWIEMGNGDRNRDSTWNQGFLHVSSVRSPELDGLKLKTWGPEYLTHNNLTTLMEKVWFKQKFFPTCSIKTIGGDMIPMVADDIATVSYPIVVSWDDHS